ncbi:MAG: hypothetical protein ACOC80_07160 [Petrotogales bacterium]
MEEKNKNDLIIIAIGLFLLILLVFFSSIRDNKENKINNELSEDFIQGWVVDSFDTNKTFLYNETEYNIWSLTLSLKNGSIWENRNFSVIYINNLSPPPEEVHLKLFYEKSNEIFVIKRIKSLG